MPRERTASAPLRRRSGARRTGSSRRRSIAPRAGRRRPPRAIRASGARRPRRRAGRGRSAAPRRARRARRPPRAGTRSSARGRAARRGPVPRRARAASTPPRARPPRRPRSPPSTGRAPRLDRARAGSTGHRGMACFRPGFYGSVRGSDPERAAAPIAIRRPATEATALRRPRPLRAPPGLRGEAHVLSHQGPPGPVYPQVGAETLRNVRPTPGRFPHSSTGTGCAWGKTAGQTGPIRRGRP